MRCALICSLSIRPGLTGYTSGSNRLHQDRFLHFYQHTKSHQVAMLAKSAMKLSLVLTPAFFTITTQALPQLSILTNSTHLNTANATLTSENTSSLTSNKSRLDFIDRSKQSPDKKVCQGPRGNSWYVFRDTAERNATDFCSQSEQTKKYNEGTAYELGLSVTKLDLSPQDSPDCLGRLKEVIEDCDSVTNSYNFLVGSTLATDDGWTYSMTPLSNKLNDVSCDAFFHPGYDVFEIRGWNWFKADQGNGARIQKALWSCGVLTHWNFEWTPDNCCFQWHASGRLQNGVKGCVGRALLSAGGSSGGRCS